MKNGYLIFCSVALIILIINCKTCSLEFFYQIGIWSESMYLRGHKPSTKYRPSRKDVISYARRMKKYQIRYLYLFAGPFKSNGKLPTYPFTEYAKVNVQLIKRYHSEGITLPWIGGIQHRTVFLDDSTWVKNALESTKKLVEHLKVPGVHVDFEYLLPGDPYLDRLLSTHVTLDRLSYAKKVNQFHEKLRIAMPDAFISSVVVSTSPLTKHWKQQTTLEELDQLSKFIDQLSFLFYDTQIHDSTQFRQAGYDLVRDIHYLKQRNPKVQYLVAIGTFINEPQLHKYRNLEIESIENTLDVIKDAEHKISQGAEAIIDGIAIYCDWETSKAEYQEFYYHWVKNRFSHVNN